MTRITKFAEECNAIPTASYNNAAFTENVSDGNISNRDGEEENPTFLLSRELAITINSKKPDLTAALILYGLYTWQISKRSPFGYNPTINGKPACYRSLRELEKEYPWLRHNSILKAINRAEKALDGEFIVQRDKDQLHFLLSDKLIKKYKFDLKKNNGLVRLKLNDAIKYSGIVEAVLLSNLRHVTDSKHNTDPVIDECGNIYRELSPAKFTHPAEDKHGQLKAPLPVHRDTLAAAIKHLVEDSAIVEHPERSGFFTPVSGMIKPKGNADKVTRDADKVTTHADKVTSKSEVLIHKCYETSNLQCKFKTLDSNEDSNRDRKCLITETFSLRSHVSVGDSYLSSDAKKLNDLINHDLAVYRQRLADHPLKEYNIKDYAIYNVIDEDKVQLVGYELMDDFIPVSLENGKTYSRITEIDCIIKQLKMDFRMSRFKYSTADLFLLRQIFIDHPLLTYEHFQELWHHIHTDRLQLGKSNKWHKSHDFYCWAKCIKNLKHFLRYLPQLIKEFHILEKIRDEDYLQTSEDSIKLTIPFDDLGTPMFDYSEMKEPFLSIAFAGDATTPVTYDTIETTVMEEVKDYIYHFAKENPSYRYKPKYAWVRKYTKRPVYYSEFVGEPTKEFVEHESNPMISCCNNSPSFEAAA